MRKRPVLSKCHARIVCFAIPVEHLSEQVVIVGRGSFASYRDFRAFLDRGLTGPEISIAPGFIETALRFTTPGDACKACDIVRNLIGQLLRNEQENVSLKHRMHVLQDVMGRWDVPARQDPVAVYDQLIESMFHLTDVKHVQLFFLDRHQGIYEPIHVRHRGNDEPEPLTFDEQDPVVRLLQAHKPYVASADPVLGHQRDLLQSGKASWFFPLWISGALEGIAGLGNSALRGSDIRMIGALCTKAALAIENLRLHTELSLKFERFSATVELAKTLTPVRSYDALLQSFMFKSTELLRAERGSLMILDRETDALLLEAQKGINEGFAEKMSIPKGQGIAGKVAEMGEPLLVTNLESDPRVLQQNREHYKTRSFLSLPLKIGNRTIGVLNLSDKISGDVFNEDDLQLIQSFASHAVVVLERNVLYNQTRRLKKLSITDSLTGLLNRRYLEERLEEELARSSRHNHALCLMTMDIDGFKLYNDAFGHPAGDKLLKRISEAITRSVRTTDIAARFGGDEFLVLLPETEPALAMKIADRVHREVFRIGTAFAQGRVAVTISIGIASYPRNGQTLEQVIEQADRALYQAKMKGKNRIEVLA